MNDRERARVAANKRWSKPGARQTQSTILKAALRRRLQEAVDPDGTMSPEELDAAIINARKAQMARVRAHRRTDTPAPSPQPLRSATR